MRKISLLVSFTFFLLAIPLVIAQNSCLETAKNDSSILYFFYGDGCPHCAAAEPFLQDLEQKYNFTIVSHETWHNATNQQIFEQFLVAYNVPKNSWGVPGFFMGSRYVIGFDNKYSKGKDVEQMVQDCLTNSCQQKESVIRFYLFGKNFEISKNISVFYLGVILGFVDGFNPCTFAILIFLLSYLFTLSASKKKILKLGLIFTFVIFLVYIMIMLGLINLVSFIGFRGIGRVIIALILIFIGLINVKDFFFKGIGPSMEIPKWARPTLENYLKKATVPAIIILAVILSFVELGCTLGLPLAYVGILSENSITGFSSFMYIFLYNIFYVVPLLIIIFLIYFFVLEAERAEHYRQKLRKWMKLAGGLLMLILAILMLMGRL